MWIASNLAVWLLGASLAAAGGPAEIHHCVGTHGEIVFSGQPCGSMGAEIAPRAGVPARHGFSHQCALTTDDLIDRVAAAFDTGNVNLLGGLFLWRGIGNRTAYRKMRDIKEWLHEPLIAIDLVSIHGPAWRAPRQGAPQALALQTAGGAPGTEPTERRFAVEHRDGCVWLRF